MVCAYCGARIPEDSVFCEQCGRRQPEPGTPEGVPAAEPVLGGQSVPDPEPVREGPAPGSGRPPRTHGKPGAGAALCAALLLLSGIAGGRRIALYTAGGWRQVALCVAIYAAGILTSAALLFTLVRRNRLRELSMPGYALLGAAHAAGIYLLALLFSLRFA